jgi:hypothetical protein
MNQRIVGALPKPDRRIGYGYCDRCGIDIKIRSDGRLHLCLSCRSDRVYIQAVTESAQCQDSM